jgi:hypothetical protein
MAAKHLLLIYPSLSYYTPDTERPRLNELFRHKAVIVEVRHPEHGCVASCHIPLHGQAYKHFFGHEHPLTFHASEHLSAEEYARCTTVVRMPVDLNVDFITCSGYRQRERENLPGGWDGVEVKWGFWPDDFDPLNGKFTGFLRDEENFYDIGIFLSLTCSYTHDIEEDQMLAAEPKALKGTVELYMNGEYTSIDHCGYDLEFLYLMESWYLAVTHMRPDTVVEPMLRQLFQDTYMLIEVKAAHATWSYYAGELRAFALVPLWDEAALMSLFQEQTTPLHFVKEKSTLPEAERRFIQATILDLSRHREIELSGKRGNRDVDTTCHLVAAGQAVHFKASILPDHQAEGKTSQRFTVKLEAELFVYASQARRSQQFDSVLDLWKFLSICMTRDAFY